MHDLGGESYGILLGSKETVINRNICQYMANVVKTHYNKSFVFPLRLNICRVFVPIIVYYLQDNIFTCRNVYV